MLLLKTPLSYLTVWSNSDKRKHFETLPCLYNYSSSAESDTKNMIIIEVVGNIVFYNFVIKSFEIAHTGAEIL